MELVKLARRDRQSFDCATWLHKARRMRKEDFKKAVAKELTGRETEPWEIVYFKLCQSQMPVIEKAIETAEVLRRDDWRCQSCGAMSNLEVHHQEFRSHSGPDSEENLITLCSECHGRVHGRDA